MNRYDIELVSVMKLLLYAGVTSASCLVCYFIHLPTQCKVALSRLIQVSFSTSPSNSPTHWKQTVFYLEQPINVTQGKKRALFLLFISTTEFVYKGQPCEYDIPLPTTLLSINCYIKPLSTISLGV